jgi:ribonuclease P protein subunit POP4
LKHTPRNIYYHELIGLKAKVLQYPDPGITGIAGRILDETLKTLILETPNGRRVRILKEHGVFEFMLPDGRKVIIKGNEILDRPEDRLKNILRKR